MVDTRNTSSQITQALRVNEALFASRPVKARQIAAALRRDGEAHGFAEPILALCDAVLVAAWSKAEASARIKGDSPRGGDLLKDANLLLGVYEQLYAAFVVAKNNGV